MDKKRNWESTLIDNGNLSQRTDIEMLTELIKEDKIGARALFMNSDNHRFENQNTYLFRDVDSFDFDIVIFRLKVGVSVTNKFYRHSKRMVTLRYREKTGFWLVMNGRIQRPIDFSGRDFNLPSVVRQFLATEFTWYRCILENGIELSRRFTLHTVWSKKLFTLDKLLKGFYGLPIQGARTLHRFNNNNNRRNEITHIQYYKRWMKNMENIQFDILDNHFRLFYDSLKMAKKLDKVVNCSWGIKRLKEEHDAWSSELTAILYVADNRPLKNSGVFIHFTEYSGYKMMETTRELAEEGMKQKHCVGTYASNVDSGNSAIYHVDGYTLQLSVNKGGLVNSQFRGFTNKGAPEDLIKKVRVILDEFNEEFKGHQCFSSKYYQHPSQVNENDDLFDVAMTTDELDLSSLNLVDIRNPQQYPNSVGIGGQFDVIGLGEDLPF